LAGWACATAGASGIVSANAQAQLASVFVSLIFTKIPLVNNYSLSLLAAAAHAKCLSAASGFIASSALFRPVF
jgi:hypothetical protein